MADVTAAPSFKKRTNKSSNVRKRPATPPPEDSSSGSDFTDDEAGVRVKRRKREGFQTSSVVARPEHDLSKSTKFEADRNANIRQNDDATKLSSWYTDASLAAAAAADKSTTATGVAGDGIDGSYKGVAKYDNFLQKNPDRQLGPVKAPTNVRTITVTDFAPDVCKDYKQTGFCGYGDGCKFLHARENYKQGWQLDKDWERAGKADKPGAKSKDDEGLDDEEKMLKEIPFKCIICKGDYKNPVVTKCGHYFCEKCAMQRYMKDKKRTCANCGADTGGSFAMARKLKNLLDRKTKRDQERRTKAIAAGEEAEDDENGTGD